MNNKERKKHKISSLSEVSKKLVLQYFIAITGYVVGLFLLIFLAWGFCNILVWYENNPLYWFLQFIKENIIIFTAIIIFLGWIVITYYFISKPLRYLDEVVAASEQLVAPTLEPISLSGILSDTEKELNRVREKALSDARAAKDAEQRKNDLVVYLAHDLKTPLTSVIGYLTLLRDEGQISEELREKYLSIALDKAERLEDLINEFFEITRFNLTNIELRYNSVNLLRMLEQISFEFGPMFQEKNLTSDIKAPSDIMIKCDVNKIQRVFDNLLRNAVFYSYENSTIEITAKENDKETIILFVNRGNTIPKEKLERIFEQFYRLDTSRSSNNGGAGLGLAIAKEIVNFHNGTITANSENEKVEFVVTLPKK